jgi:hypothetical protein
LKFAGLRRFNTVGFIPHRRKRNYDAVCYRNFSERIPFNTLHDLPGMYTAFSTIRELASSEDLVLPGHDPLVLERLTKVGDGIVEL